MFFYEHVCVQLPFFFFILNGSLRPCRLRMNQQHYHVLSVYFRIFSDNDGPDFVRTTGLIGFEEEGF